MTVAARYPGIRVTANGNQLVSYHTETRIADAGVFYPITPSTEGGELFQQAYAEGHLNVFGKNTIAIETEGEHAAQGSQDDGSDQPAAVGAGAESGTLHAGRGGAAE